MSNALRMTLPGLRAPIKPAVKPERKKREAASPLPDGARIEDFYAYLPDHKFIYMPTGALWPAASVDSLLPPVDVPMREKPQLPSKWLDQNRAVQQAIWAPGLPKIVENKLMADGGWIPHHGAKVFNLYKPPPIPPPPIAGFDVGPWINHIRYVFPDEAEHIIKFLAHRVQKPEEKINHALVLGGMQGVGKDSILEPVKYAIGPWNFVEVSPKQVIGRFNGFVKSVILRISEARDRGEADRYEFYETMKTYTAAPPDVLRVDEKNLREHAVMNVMGVVITTNHRDSLHLPADDRRHFVAWSPRERDQFVEGYWPALWKWFASGGNAAVADYLAKLDISDFDPKAPPVKTAAFWATVDLGRPPEDAELADALEKLKNPDAVTKDQVHRNAKSGSPFQLWLGDRRNARMIGHRFEACDYVAVRNPTDKRDGLWVIEGKRQTVYAKKHLALRDQIAAAKRLTTPSPPG
ncbi:primase-helicase family protein [Nitrobacter sp.]|uniref:primase-helicase family protein n=1 Tax=Nitrobacter sp. TaxID=29420 RepID=UPI0029CAB804|nr:DUF5906 domain-containing protein [Nitrobacter sp.]